MNTNDTTKSIKTDDLEPGYVLAEAIIISGVRQYKTDQKLTLSDIKKLKRWDIETVTVYVNSCQAA